MRCLQADSGCALKVLWVYAYLTIKLGVYEPVLQKHVECSFVGNDSIKTAFWEGICKRFVFELFSLCSMSAQTAAAVRCFESDLVRVQGCIMIL